MLSLLVVAVAVIVVAVAVAVIVVVVDVHINACHSSPTTVSARALQVVSSGQLPTKCSQTLQRQNASLLQ